MPAVGLGFVLGIFYLVIRIFRSVLSDNKAVVFVADVIFCVVCTLSSFLLFVAVNNGHIRFYLIVAQILGFCVFSFTFGELIFGCFLNLFAFFKKILSPIFVPFKLLGRKIDAIKKKLSEKTENFKNKFKKLLKQRSQVLYNNVD